MTGPLHPTGHARVSARSPRAHAICDRCGRRFNRDRLIPQQQWSGLKLQTYNILVCTGANGCYDRPQPQLRTLIIPPDPMPVLNPRPEQYVTIVPSYMATVQDQHFVTSSGANLTMMIRVTPTQTPPGFLAG